MSLGAILEVKDCGQPPHLSVIPIDRIKICSLCLSGEDHHNVLDTEPMLEVLRTSNLVEVRKSMLTLTNLNTPGGCFPYREMGTRLHFLRMIEEVEPLHPQMTLLHGWNHHDPSDITTSRSEANSYYSFSLVYSWHW